MVGECNKQIILCEPSRCTGCAACLSICPTNSITMQEDMYAEIHPVINELTCIKCGLCMTSCPQLRKVNLAYPDVCYAAWRSDSENRKSSSSGGISALLAESIISQNGVFYGVEFDRDRGVAFTRITKKEDIEKTKGSKYVQADLGMNLRKIGEDLSNNKLVLFVGSPCQVAGLKSYINNSRFKKYDSYLITVDFLCHGTVPQRYLFEDLESIENRIGFRVDKCVFRSNIPENNYYLTLFEKGNVRYQKKAELDRYFYCFLHAITCRESCMSCDYKQSSRAGDITIGDFIGLGEDIPFEFVEGINPSVVFVNSAKGKFQIDRIINKGTFINRTIDEAVEGGPSLKPKLLSSKARYYFRKRYVQKGFVASTEKLEYVMRVGIFISKFKMIFTRIKRKTKKIIRRCM